MADLGSATVVAVPGVVATSEHAASLLSLNFGDATGVVPLSVLKADSYSIGGTTPPVIVVSNPPPTTGQIWPRGQGN